MVKIYPSRGVIEVENPKARNENEKKKMFTYDAVYDEKQVLFPTKKCIKNELFFNILVQHNKICLMRLLDHLYLLFLRDIIAVFLPMVRQVQEKHSLWKVVEIWKKKEALYLELLNKYGLI